MQDAIDACSEENEENTNSTKIEMLANTKESIIIPEKKNIILDLCGATITATTTSQTTGNTEQTKENPTITVNGTLTIIDSKENEDGSLKGIGKITASEASAIVIGETGKLTLGTNESATSGNEADEEMNIEEPVIDGGQYGIEITEGGTLNYFDGQVSGTEAPIYPSPINPNDSAYPSENIDTPTKYVVIYTEENGKIVGNLVKIYEIKFDKNDENAEIEYDSDYVITGKEIEKLPEATKTGYTFVGWVEEIDDQTQSIEENTIVKIPSDHTLKAIWIDETEPTNSAPATTATTSTITVTIAQNDLGSGIDAETVKYAIGQKNQDGEIEWSDWQTSNTFAYLQNDQEFYVKTIASDNDGNGPVESEPTLVKTHKIELGTYITKIASEETNNGTTITPTPNSEDDTNQINTDMKVTVIPSAEGTTTLTITGPITTNTLHPTIPTETTIETDVSNGTKEQTIETRKGLYELTITTTDGTNTVEETKYIWFDRTNPAIAPEVEVTTKTISVKPHASDIGSGIETITFDGLDDAKAYTLIITVTDHSGNTITEFVEDENQNGKVTTNELVAGTIKLEIETETEEQEIESSKENYINENFEIILTPGNAETRYVVKETVIDENGNPQSTTTEYTDSQIIITKTAEYEITVITTDGINTKTNTYYVMVDQENPTVEYETNGGNTYTVPVGETKVTVSSQVTASDEGGSDIAKIEYAWTKDNENEPSNWIETENEGTVTNENATGGSNYLWVKATDTAGNVKITVSNDFNVGYEVKYNTNNGTVEITSQRKEQGTSLQLSDGEEFSRLGYTLIGWSTTSSSIIPEYALSDNFEENEPTEIFAIWSPNTNTAYTVQFFNQENGIYSEEPTRIDGRIGTTDTQAEITVEADEIENYELIKNTNEFKAELEQMKPSYGVYNNSNKEVQIKTATIKVERLKGVGIINKSEGTITLGTEDDTLNNASPIIYAIADNVSAIVNSDKGSINFFDGRFVTLNSIKNLITKVLTGHMIDEDVGEKVINSTLKLIVNEEETEEEELIEKID